MPSGRLQAQELERAPDTEQGARAREPEVAPRGRAIWPWAVALALVGLAAVGLLAPWSQPPPAGPTERQAVAVLSAPLERGSLTVRRRYPGELFADAVEVTSRIAGHVSEVPVRIGDAVQAGDVLSRLDDAVLRRRVRETEAQIRAQRSIAQNAKIAVEAAERDVVRARGLTSSGAVSQQELDELETARRQREAEQATAQAQLEEARARLAVLKEDLRDTSVRAPFTGIVARRDVDVGAFVQPGMPLLRVVARDPLRIRFRVPEQELQGLEAGLSFQLDTRLVATEPTTGTVTRLSGEVSAADRTLLVEGVVEQHGALRPGMYADVVLQVQELEHVWTAPEAALVERVDAGGRQSMGVFVVEGPEDETVARWVHVRVLGRDGGRIALDPIDVEPSAGDHVLVRGHRELTDGTPVRLVATDEGATP